MPDGADHLKELKQNVGAIVAGSLIAVGLTEGLAAGFASAIEHRDLQPGADDYIEFGALYLATFLLSATLTAAVAVWVVPPLYGTQVHWMWPIVVLVGGASMTGLTVVPEGGTPAGWVLGALQTFSEYYGTAASAGFIVGCAGGAIVYCVADHLKKAS